MVESNTNIARKLRVEVTVSLKYRSNFKIKRNHACDMVKHSWISSHRGEIGEGEGVLSLEGT